MKRIQAVFAHFNSDDQVEESFLSFIEQAAKYCFHVLIVSTSKISKAQIFPDNVEFIERSNIGYDFCSYRLGIESSLAKRSFDSLLLVNNSLFFSGRFELGSILNDLDALPHEICGLTSNYQFSPHVQSPFLYFKKAALLTSWFTEFWSLVQPVATKKQIVFNFEIGLTATARSRGLSCGCLYGPPIQKIAEKSSIVSRLKAITLPPFARKENPYFQSAKEIYIKFGLLKWEYIKDQTFKTRNGLKFLCAADRASISEQLSSNKMKKHSSFDERLDVGHLSHSQNFSFTDHELKNEHLPQLCVVVHLYYSELLAEIIDQISFIPDKFDLVLTVTDLGVGMNAKAFIRERLLIEPTIVIVENRGRDVLPFIYLVNQGYLDKYELICKLHTKRSLYSDKGGLWRQEILSELLGSSENVINILHAFKTDPTLGVCGPSRTFLTQPEYWGANRQRVEELLAKMALNSENPELRFFAGTMFWIRSSILQKLRILSLQAHEFEDELGQQDGTLAHALERLFLIVAESSGFHGKTCGLKFQSLAKCSTNKPVVYE